MTRVHPARGITQGTIFSCAVAQGYADCDVFGLVITARCDTAQEKVELVNYVPIVRWQDWLEVDGARFTARRARAAAVAGLAEVLKSAGLSDTILATIPEESIISELAKVTTKDGKARKEKFERFRDERNTCDRFFAAATPSDADPSVIMRRFPKLARGLAEDVLRHALADCHYLEAIEPGEDSDGYVVLLREIRWLSFEAVTAINGGLDHDQFLRLSREGGVQLHFRDAESFALPLSVVRSPDIEQILQRFTNLFARVGVEDIDRSRKSRLHATITAFESEPQ